MKWQDAELPPGIELARVCGVYEVSDPRIPSRKYRVRVLERMDGSFAAFPNIAVVDGGEPGWTSGLGRSEVEALQDAIRWLSRDLGRRTSWEDADFEWSDPRDF